MTGILDLGEDPSPTGDEYVRTERSFENRDFPFKAKPSNLLVRSSSGGAYKTLAQWVNDLGASGGYVPGGTDVAVADGGTGASTAADARTNLGLAIGADVQAWDADLDTLAALGNWKVAYTNGSGNQVALAVGALGTVLAGQGVSAAPSFTNAPQITTIELGHATDTTIARVSAGVVSIEGSNILLASGLGSITQAYSANLATLSAPGNWKVTYTDGSGVQTALTVGAAGTAFCGNGVTAAPSWQGVCLTANNLSDVTAATARTNLGLGSIATFPETTAAQYAANTSGKALSTDKVWSAASTVTAMSDAASYAPDFSLGFDFNLTLGSTCSTTGTLANPTNIKVGQRGVIRLIQDATGGRKISTYGTYYKFSGGSKPNNFAAASNYDMITYSVKSSTEIECSFGWYMS